MKNFIKYLGIIALAAVIVFSIAACSDGGNQIHVEPIEVSINLIPVAWESLLSDLESKGRYVALDLSGCTGMETFDPVSHISTGKSWIVSLVLPDTTTEIVDGFGGDDDEPYAPTFWHFTNLKKISGVNVVTIGNHAFRDCPTLADVNFPKAKKIGIGAFRWCTRLISVEFPAVESIGDRAFIYNPGLTSVSFPAATKIGEDAFQGCERLASVEFRALENISNGAFGGLPRLAGVSFPAAKTIGGNAFDGCTNLTNANFPSVIDVGTFAFVGCTSLTAVNFPSATDISFVAFYECTGLTSVDFDKVTTIGGQVFDGCTSLSTVNIPSIQEIGGGVFARTGSTALTITMGATAPAVGGDLFTNVDSPKSVTVRVPGGAAGNYDDAWKEAFCHNYDGNNNINLTIQTY